MTSPQYKECMNNNIIVNGLLAQMIVYFLQSLLLRTITRPPTCKTAHRMPVWLIERSRTILVISNVFWEVYHLETMLKLSYNLSKKRIYPCSFLKFCNYAWIMRLLTNYAKSCDLRSITRNRNIAEYQKPWKGGNQILQQHNNLLAKFQPIQTGKGISNLVTYTWNVFGWKWKAVTCSRKHQRAQELRNGGSWMS